MLDLTKLVKVRSISQHLILRLPLVAMFELAQELLTAAYVNRWQIARQQKWRRIIVCRFSRTIKYLY